MKIKICLSLLLSILFISCTHKEVKPKSLVKNPLVKSQVKKDKKIEYPEKELIAFIDSVAKLPLKPMMDKVAFQPDSIFRNRQSLNKKISASDFKILKKSIADKWIDLKTAHRIFGEFKIGEHDTMDGKVPVIFTALNKEQKLTEFAISLGPSALEWANNVYFFKSKKLISKHYVYHRYGLELNYYNDIDGKTVFYYKQNFESGSGIWWFNYYFYKYDGDKIIPILNELENANMTWPGNRHVWLESTIVKTNPLTLKMVYRQQPFCPCVEPETQWIINDSTFVEYKWNEKRKILEGDYAHSKISRAQILTYYLEENELLFIRNYHQLLKQELQNPKQKETILYYLFDVKHNH